MRPVPIIVSVWVASLNQPPILAAGTKFAVHERRQQSSRSQKATACKQLIGARESTFRLAESLVRDGPLERFVRSIRFIVEINTVATVKIIAVRGLILLQSNPNFRCQLKLNKLAMMQRRPRHGGFWSFKKIPVFAKAHYRVPNSPSVGSKNMRQSCSAALVLSIAVLTIGCQQAPNASSPLTPVGTFAPAPSLAPVSGTSTGIGPLGGRTRIPPPATGSYSVPNNYMGGAAPIGQANLNQRPVDSFANSQEVRPAGFADSGFADANGSSGLAPTSFGAGIDNQPAGNGLPSSPMQSPLGGMQVHDLTRAPPPPGYRGSPPAFIPNQQFPANGNGGYAPSGYPNHQPTQQLNSAPPVRFPSHIPGAEMASQFGSNHSSISIAQRPGGSGMTRETPIQPSRLEPSFSAPASQFQTQTPSTEPVSNALDGQSNDLPWRRPTAAY